ncbi:MAG: alpha/beta hydrolase [Cyanobacteriota bacterium]|nr:alpha/beta hydrolase [Cyanobacteriota bacterium]
MANLTRGPLLTLTVQGHCFGYHQLGSGELLVLLNGDAMCMSMWPDALLQALAAQFTVVIVDYPGMGRSQAAPEGGAWLIPELASLMEAFITDLAHGRRVHLLGFSSGGEIALQIAVRHPSWLASVTSVAGDAGGEQFVGDPAVMQRIAQSSPEELLALLFPADQQAAMQAYVAELMSRPQDGASAEVLAAQEQAWLAWLAGGIWDALPRISAPVLVLNGLDDALVDPENARRLAERIPTARLELVSDAGHGVLLQEPQAMAQLIQGFIAESGSRSQD